MQSATDPPINGNRFGWPPLPMGERVGVRELKALQGRSCAIWPARRPLTLPSPPRGEGKIGSPRGEGKTGCRFIQCITVVKRRQPLRVAPSPPGGEGRGEGTQGASGSFRAPFGLHGDPSPCPLPRGEREKSGLRGEREDRLPFHPVHHPCGLGGEGRFDVGFDDLRGADLNLLF